MPDLPVPFAGCMSPSGRIEIVENLLFYEVKRHEMNNTKGVLPSPERAIYNSHG